MQTTKAPNRRRSTRPDRVVELGITVRHSRRCGIRTDGKCNCSPAYQGQVWAARDGKPLRKTFPTIREARKWRQAAAVDLARRQITAPVEETLEKAAEKWLVAAKAGIVRTRSGEAYKPSAIRGYERVLKRALLPELGSRRLSAITRNQIQDLIDIWTASGLAPATVRNMVLPLRLIFKRAVSREEVAVNPTHKLDLPRGCGRRERVAPPREVQALLEVLPPHYRALWTTAVYSGLRRGELQALHWHHIDLDAGIIRVEGNWDRVVGMVEPKSNAGRRKVPVPRAIARELRSYRLWQGNGGEGFVFSINGGERPFDPSNAMRTATRLWDRAGLTKLGFHEARHTYASLMIAAGVNAKALSTYMGHSSITVTLDRYGHLFPGNEKEAADMLDHYLERDLGSGILRVVR